MLEEKNIDFKEINRNIFIYFIKSVRGIES